MASITLGTRPIGDDHLPLIIAEVGINHEGELAKAIELVDSAAGAECVKFQCHMTGYEMIQTDMKPGDISDEALWDIIERCELTADEEMQVKRYRESKGIIYVQAVPPACGVSGSVLAYPRSSPDTIEHLCAGAWGGYLIPRERAVVEVDNGSISGSSRS